LRAGWLARARIVVRQAVMNAKSDMRDFNCSLNRVDRRGRRALLTAREANPGDGKTAVLAFFDANVVVYVADANVT
jgi:hypothetical protein